VALYKTYIVYYSWENTIQNHTGMAYLVKELKNAYPRHIKLIEIPQNINKWTPKLQRLHFYFLAFYLRYFLAKSEKVLFMEYLGNNSGNQTGLAIKLREWGVKNCFFGLVHLPGKNLVDLYCSEAYIKKAVEAVDNLIVLGSSLVKFFDELGYGHKVTKTFHYVDTSYYKPSSEPKPDKLQVIHMGSLNRNFKRLAEIVNSCPEIDFHICQGNSNLSECFIGNRNVKLYGFLSEEELLKLMHFCHVSLSVLDDSIGSNVITTSLASGLINVVSDVGSVRDYCNEENSLFCKGNEDFINALLLLLKDKKLVKKLSVNAIYHAQKLNLKQSITFFGTILTND
jgi:glycosyltransferase involved in cell wall biosynthesis